MDLATIDRALRQNGVSAISVPDVRLSEVVSPRQVEEKRVYAMIDFLRSLRMIGVKPVRYSGIADEESLAAEIQRLLSIESQDHARMLADNLVQLSLDARVHTGVPDKLIGLLAEDSGEAVRHQHVDAFADYPTSEQIGAIMGTVLRDAADELPEAEKHGFLWRLRILVDRSALPEVAKQTIGGRLDPVSADAPKYRPWMARFKRWVWRTLFGEPIPWAVASDSPQR